MPAVFSAFGMQCFVYMTLHLIQFSRHFNGIADTCVAMDDWLQNPTAHTALGQILPCVDNATAYGTLSSSKDVTFQTVNNVNKFITNEANKNGTGPNSFSQSGPLVPALCNPYHSDMTNRKCITGEVDFSNADAKPSLRSERKLSTLEAKKLLDLFWFGYSFRCTYALFILLAYFCKRVEEPSQPPYASRPIGV
ncbi:hypothetical protein SO802_005903 [Lithocarpus litseifolius]|uniref:Uncharacterized protein n=1 Tax=Lithocarpus litseifolius TaxID=425828 RepID=A0AAW2DNL9_9ROSI